ncbi:hypothetical protein R6Q59_019008 [Mikania micrantha]|uniref:TCP domain-containing protein n=1 Tax=Mikania micrantha TaxID=192012 RepID=A0A5N6LYT5_9ASTR|nr:hypothetical protein E3N88_34670 [Mikania micrantha]
MEENNHHHLLNHRPARWRNTGGDGKIVKVDGGHIIRSTGKKDRHSKVLTAKGPRDRRVRLSAHTAIQFYDVQDRLGYDRPSKAVDWLIKQAKSSIDELAKLPAWKPTVGSTPVVNLEQKPDNENVNYHHLSELNEHPDEDIVDNYKGNFHVSSFLPASHDSIKSIFPTGSSSSPASNNGYSAMQFHHSLSQNQDLKLSLQSFQNPIFDSSGWPENDGISGSVFNSPAATRTTPFLRPLVGKPTNSQLLNYISQRRPLQSSNSPAVRAWVNPPPFSGAGIGQDHTLGFHHPSYMPGIGSGIGEFSGFDYPARIWGDEEEHDGISNKPSSASSDSRH